MEDKEIIALYWERSENAISETTQKYGKYCHYIAYGILRDPEDVAECINDAYLRVWNAIPPARPDNLRTFLGKIVRNLALNQWEKRTAEKRGGGEVPKVLDELAGCIPDGDDSQFMIDRIVLRDLLNRFLATLRPEVRKIFLQRYWYLRSVKEIAADLDITESKVTVTLYRSRQKLAKLLEKEGFK